jgi:predicted FMN-binding regulatory protein PaiB
VDDAPSPYIAGQLRAIVGVEVLIDRVEGTFTLSQNGRADEYRAQLPAWPVELLGKPMAAQGASARGRRFR